MDIRRLTPADAAEYQALRLFALCDSPTAFGSSYEEECDRPTEVIAARLAPDSGRILFGAFIDGVLAGSVCVCREEGLKERHRALVLGMIVRPEYRGGGVGKALLTHALVCAKSMPGLRQIALAATAGNHAAIGLYQSCGFVPWGIAPQALQVAGMFYDEVHMALQL